MKKYKHKETNVVVIHESVGKYMVEDWGKLSQKNNSISLNFDFNDGNWQEITEKFWGVSVMKEEPNYLITAFRETKDLFGERKIASIGKDGLYGGWHTLEGMLKNPPCVESNDFEIYSVKNSKGKAFILNETVKFSHIKLPIIKFEISDFNGQMNVILSNGNRYGLDAISEVKKIYTTTDSVDIYEGDDINLFIANKQLTIPQINAVNTFWFSNSDKEVADRYLTFTSEENRDKYIKENTKKPVIVTADGKEIFEGDSIYHFYKPFEYVMHKSIVKHNTIYGDVIFYTEEKAKEYIDFNKPKYSLSDIENCYPHANITGNRIKDIPVVATLFSNLKKLGK